MSYLLDTDTASAYMKGNPQVFSRFIQHAGRLNISILSLAEMYSWVHVAQLPDKREAGLRAMLSDVTVLPIDDDIARRCGEVRASLQREGLRVPTIDMLIASTALLHDLTVVTNNTRHFKLVPDLRIESWHQD